MKKTAKIIAVALILVVVAVLATNSLLTNTDNKFYVGVTYCGSTVEEAKLLIDKVKNYTNLFVLMSGELQRNYTAMDEIGDYAIASGLNFAIYCGVDDAYQKQTTEWIGSDSKGGANSSSGYTLMTNSRKFLEAYIDYQGMEHPSSSLGQVVVSSNERQNTIYYSNGTVRETISIDDKSKTVPSNNK